jgi:deoxyribose-phosphate aldolase
MAYSESDIRELVRRVVDEVGEPESRRRAAGGAAPGAGDERSVAIGADHGGFQLKEKLAAHLRERGYAVEDCGTHDTTSVDYPDFAHAVARRVGAGASRWGVIVDGAGIGSCMVANKVPGVRAALCYDLSSASTSREQRRPDRRQPRPPDPRRLARDAVGRRPSRPPGGDDRRHRGRVRLEATGSEEAVSDREKLIEAITRRVMAELEGAPEERCADCEGCCAARCSDKVRCIVDEGACRIAYCGNGADVPSDLARYIDHTLLKPDTTASQIDRLCEEALEYGFASVCVNPVWVRRCISRVRGSQVKVTSVVGFPLGANAPEIKLMEARRALRDGAREIDMVINIGALKAGDHELVERDIAGVVDACREVGAVSKVIIEAVALSDEEKVVACRLSRRAKADFVKTSTGFGGGGATLFDVALMRETVGPAMGVKASGGIHNTEEALGMLAAGATRIGASAGIKIITGGKGA